MVISICIKCQQPLIKIFQSEKINKILPICFVKRCLNVLISINLILNIIFFLHLFLAIYTFLSFLLVSLSIRMICKCSLYFNDIVGKIFYCILPFNVQVFHGIQTFQSIKTTGFFYFMVWFHIQKIPSQSPVIQLSTYFY